MSPRKKTSSSSTLVAMPSALELEILNQTLDGVGEVKVDYLNLLVSSGLAMSELDDYEQLLEHIAGAAITMGQCEGCSIYEAEGGSLRFIKSRNIVFEQRNVQTGFKSFVLPINMSTMAGYTALCRRVVNIPDVYHLPAGSPFTYNPSFDTLMNYRSQSMLAIPMMDSKGQVLGVLQLINRNENGTVVPFPSVIEPYLRALGSQFGVVMRNMRMQLALRQSRIETVKKFVKASEYHDTDTGGHIERMSRYSVLLYKALGYNEYDCEVMSLASMLHDVGKISTPDAVLKKPGKLNADEWEIMKRHTISGYEMLNNGESPFLQKGALIAYTHHEKWDGSGYPRALKGEDIPIEGRVVALADVFDALCSRRCYKESWPLDRVLEEIKLTKGTHFDPGLVDLFLECLDGILEIQAQFPVEPQPVLVSSAC